tara:strand:- start:101 stop:631 length:531 start_codon:yes stop_codon:yes gene_type:complete
MAILRAGPFAISSNSFFDEPATASLTILPVNCAKDTSSASWPWKRRQFRQIRDNSGLNTIQTYQNGLPSDSESEITGTGGTSPRIALSASWRYQAVNDFNITFNYSVTTNSTSSGISARARVLVNGVEVFLDEDSEEVNGSNTLTLPASVVPSVVIVSVLAVGKRDGTVEASYSVS